ncbi:MAG: YmdB family metallophosphoesterase, partial [Candidatus Pacebacteria bacterium]|nr:YmdB family metallophosphoesterase [Candidatus Paceibacterota bacterium]
KEYNIDLTIANGDNLAHGKGVTRNTVKEVIECGVDVLTCGDHIWDNKKPLDMFKGNYCGLLYPANFPTIDYKSGCKIINIDSVKILVINLIGRVFFKNYPDCPFQKADEILENHKDANIVIVDFHAEATSEKRVIGFYLNSRVSAVLGTHTHIQTSDEEILSGGTAYISDVGMVGPKDSILGCEKEAVIEQMITQRKFRYEISKDENIMINAVVLEIDNRSGKALSIKRVNEVVKLVL